jgi:hypothetical protein
MSVRALNKNADRDAVIEAALLLPGLQDSFLFLPRACDGLQIGNLYADYFGYLVRRVRRALFWVQ